MKTIGISMEDQEAIISLVAGILHLGNINFLEQGNYSMVAEKDCEYSHIYFILTILSSTLL